MLQINTDGTFLICDMLFLCVWLVVLSAAQWVHWYCEQVHHCWLSISIRIWWWPYSGGDILFLYAKALCNRVDVISLVFILCVVMCFIVVFMTFMIDPYHFKNLYILFLCPFCVECFDWFFNRVLVWSASCLIQCCFSLSDGSVALLYLVN